MSRMNKKKKREDTLALQFATLKSYTGPFQKAGLMHRLGVVHNTNDEVRAPIVWGNAMLADSLAFFFFLRQINTLIKKKKKEYILRTTFERRTRALWKAGPMHQSECRARTAARGTLRHA
jgi:hypothetical protein